MHIANYLAQRLVDDGVHTAFMLSGTGSLHLDDAFSNTVGMKAICARHEGAAVTMASAYAKITGGLGAAVVTTGPGAINALAGAAEAYVDSTPVVIVSGQVARAQVDLAARSFGVQGFDIVTPALAFTKGAWRADDPAAVPALFEDALACARSGRPGPVWIDVPLDVQAAPLVAPLASAVPPPDCAGSAQPAAGAVRQVVEALEGARRPLVVAGHGVRIAGATTALRGLLDGLGAPVMATRLGLDTLPYGHPDALGQLGERGRPFSWHVLGDADVVIVLGSSLADAAFGHELSRLAPDARLLLVDVEPCRLAREHPAVEVAPADIAALLPAVVAEIAGRDLGIAWTEWRDACRAVKSEHPVPGAERVRTPLDSYHLADCVERLTDERWVVASDAGSAYYVVGQAAGFDHGQREVTSGAFATMGLAVPLAIGAAAADPDRRVVAITGDGSIELHLQELATLAHYRLDVKVIVINNGGYASIRDSSAELCGGRYSDERENLDFVKIAAAFGLPYHRVEDHRTLEDDLARVLALPGPVLIEAICDPEQEMIVPWDPRSVFAASA